MLVNRREFLVTAGACAASCQAGRTAEDPSARGRLDLLLQAHRGKLPEREGAGANHYPMAAEVLETYGFEGEIDDAWIEGAGLYSGTLGRVAPIRGEGDIGEALGNYARLGDWLDFFQGALAERTWQEVVSLWAPRLAPALSAAAFHGVIRTGHAVRALERQDSAPRRAELAAGLSYWAARHLELPATAPMAPEELETALTRLDHPWIEDAREVDFFGVSERLLETPAAAIRLPADPKGELDGLVRDAATAFLEMLVHERSRIWLLHTVTGPAAVAWLLPYVDRSGARRLVAYARQAVLSMYTAFGQPYTPRQHLRASAAPWAESVRRAVESRSVHGIKLIDALVRFDRGGDPIWGSVAAQWFEWT